MKISILRYLISVATVLLSFCANAQYDKIITNGNDTIPCKIEESGVLGGYVYKYGQTEITTKRIKEFYNAYKTLWFRRVFFHHQVIFMKVLVRGKISIHESLGFTNGFQDVSWFASKNSDTVVSMQGGFFPRNGKRRKLFASYLKDKKAVYDQYMEMPNPDAEGMLSFAKLYNASEPFK